MISILAKPNFVYKFSSIRYLVRHVATKIEESDDVLFASHGNKGIITLNRPNSLNTLNLSMIKKIYPVIKKWENEKALVIIKGAGGKAFCAGGDVRSLILSLNSGNYDMEVLWKQYLIDGMIGKYNIPFVAFIDGIIMGGGVGMTVHGRYRIATEKTLFAMPETAIGLFPDVGVSHVLSRMKGKLGCYLALTGQKLKGSDVLKAGIATHFCESDKLKNLENILLECNTPIEIDDVINQACIKETTQFSLEPHLEKINKYFSHSTVEKIISDLENDRSKWAEETRKNLLKMSPSSLKITLKQLNLSANLNLQDCLFMDYRITMGCLRNKDFYEGVRAQLIEKDQKPIWNPKTLEEVTEDVINGYFDKLPDDQELKYKS